MFFVEQVGGWYLYVVEEQFGGVLCFYVDFFQVFVFVEVFYVCVDYEEVCVFGIVFWCGMCYDDYYICVLVVGDKNF